MKQFFIDFTLFVYKQAYACIFGGFLIAMMIMTHYWYPLGEYIARYDFLFLSALLFQVVLILTRGENKQEVIVIAIFHIVATGMEVFKTHPSIGSWTYPGNFIFGIGGVPLFAGFMYSAVGSYLARVSRIFSFSYTQYPSRFLTYILALFIYINFFSHHFIFDVRYVLIVSIVLLYYKTHIYFNPNKNYYSMPLLLGFFLVALFIWIAENIATYTKIWIYPSQSIDWNMVSISKLGSWFLLIIVSFVLISIVHQPKKYRK